MAGIKDKIKGKERETYAYNKLIGYGWSPAQASGILGNLIHESNLDPTIEGDKGIKGGSSFGIAQFRGDRLKNLQRKYGSDWQNLDNQLDYVNYELNTTHKKAGNLLRTVNTPMSAGMVVSDLYEIPQVKYYQNKDRQLSVARAYRDNVDGSYTNQYVDVQQDQPIGNIYNTQVAPYMNQFQNVSNLPITAETPILAEETETKEEDNSVDLEVEQAKLELARKQQQEINEQRFLQDILKASQVEYIDPNQTTDYTQQEQQFQNGGKIVKDDMGYWNPQNRGKSVEIGSNHITMKGVDEILWGVPDVGEPKLMLPNQEYIFPKATKVVEHPIKNKRFS